MASALWSVLAIRLPVISFRCSRHSPSRLIPTLTALKRPLQHPHRIAAPSFRMYASEQQAAATGAAPPWAASWRIFLERLHTAGCFIADPHVVATDVNADKAAVKRAVLNFSRQNAGLLELLSRGTVVSVVRSALPLPSEVLDRKIRNAQRRLEASFLEGRSLSPGEGGGADLQDVLRLVLALDAAEDLGGSPALEGLVAATGAFLPELMAAMDSPEARLGAGQMSDKAKNMLRLNKNKGEGGAAGEEAQPQRQPRRQPRPTPWARSRTQYSPYSE